MAKVAGKNAVILINGYRFSTYATMFDIKMDAGKIDVTGFSDGSKNFVPGIQTAEIDADMLWESSANSVHLAMKSMPTGICTIFPEGGTITTPGLTSLSLPSMQGNYQPKGQPAGALSIGTIQFLSYGTNAGLENGVVLADSTLTGTQSTNGVQDPTGAAVTAVCAATLHVWGLTTVDTYVVKVQHSTLQASGYADLITFSANGTARTAERQTLASGTINQWRRVLITRTGSAGDQFGFSVHFWHA